MGREGRSSRSRRRGAATAVAGLAAAMLATTLVHTASAQPTSAGGVAAESSADAVSLLRVPTPDEADVDRLVAAGADIAPVPGDGYVEVYAHGADDRERLREAGFDYDVVISDLAAHTRAVLAEDAAEARTLAASPLPSGRNTYRTYADYGTDMADLAAARPDLVEPITLPHRSLLGKEVRGLEIAHDVEADDGRPVFLLVGTHHAREWPTAEVVMEFAMDLVHGDGRDERITDLLERARIIVVPIVNVDGFDISRSYLHEYKRKNCRLVDGSDDVSPGECADADSADLGVDLNRNYGGNWGGKGASVNPASGTYRGAAPFSEPEVRNVRDLVSSRQVTSLQSVHNYGGLVLRPPQQSDTPLTADEALYAEIGDALADATGYRSIPFYQLYDTSGSTGEWSYFTPGGFGFEFELEGSNFHVGYQEAVVDQYLGIGTQEHANGGVREALLRQFEAAANRDYHAVLEVSAPRGARLSVEKTFTQQTAPVQEPGGGVGEPIPFTSTLTSQLTAPGGVVEWSVNPSVRPDRDGGTITESWTVRCERARGNAWQETQVTVARGERVAVDLSRCAGGARP
ncbi:M14 family zinc carboxypeptidase [Saccharomonospora sp. NB11]|jgi:carboxypeptidase T|uniref:M14 family zinc carboxypeptidase n=1 Tax=Saccharomonospora sp. NB11 TaxID=1642298 RepID=UPI0018D03169|nr:M14 family zinc carboxypeptidase [Saccharomonospora sp. NB11]